jgi:hypothetical protein
LYCLNIKHDEHILLSIYNSERSFSFPLWSVFIFFFLICKVYFLLWNSLLMAYQFLSFLWMTALSVMVIQIPMSCWIKTFYDWNISMGLWLWKSSFELKQIKCELLIWYTFFALYYNWMLGVNEKVMVVRNIFQWLKEFLQDFHS